jgi:hypothetical protein
MGATGLEPVTPSVSSNSTRDASSKQQGVAESQAGRCTNGCTNTAQNANVGTVEALAAALLGLSAADRARLAALLTESTQNPPVALNEPQANAGCTDTPDAG